MECLHFSELSPSPTVVTIPTVETDLVLNEHPGSCEDLFNPSHGTNMHLAKYKRGARRRGKKCPKIRLDIDITYLK